MTFNIGDKVTSKWSNSGAVWAVVEELSQLDSPTVRRKVLTKYRLENIAHNLAREEYDENLRLAKQADIDRVLVDGSPNKLAKARVAEFIRQWKISYSAEDKVYTVHFDNSTGGPVSLLISDLEEVLR